MNAVDAVITVMLLIGLVWGLVKGFVRGLLGLAGLVVGVMLAAGSYERLADSTLAFIPSERASEVVAFALVMIVVIVLVGIVARIISRALRLSALGWLDRLTGGVLGVVLAAVVAGVLILVAAKTGLEGAEPLVSSSMAPRVMVVTDVVVSVLPGGLREKLEGKYAKLRREWEEARRRGKVVGLTGVEGFGGISPAHLPAV